MSFWPVYVINMATNTARMAAAGQTLSTLGIPFQRFEAVDGRALSTTERQRIYDPIENARKFRHPLIPGELGCYLSHINLWRKIAADPAPGAVILEDDFSTDKHLRRVLGALFQDNASWDMVKLYSRRANSRMIKTRSLGPGITLGQPYQIPNTTLGYVIRREAAAQLLAHPFPLARPIDEDHKRFWEHGLSIWLALPPPLSQGAEAQSGDSIAAARKTGKRPSFGQMLAQGGKNLRYRLGYLAKLHFNRLFPAGNVKNRAAKK